MSIFYRWWIEYACTSQGSLLIGFGLNDSNRITAWFECPISCHAERTSIVQRANEANFYPNESNTLHSAQMPKNEHRKCADDKIR